MSYRYIAEKLTTRPLPAKLKGRGDHLLTPPPSDSRPDLYLRTPQSPPPRAQSRSPPIMRPAVISGDTPFCPFLYQSPDQSAPNAQQNPSLSDIYPLSGGAGPSRLTPPEYNSLRVDTSFDPDSYTHCSPSRNPLLILEDALAVWCRSQRELLLYQAYD